MSFEVVDRSAEVLQGVLGGVEAGGQFLETVPQHGQWIDTGVPGGLCGSVGRVAGHGWWVMRAVRTRAIAAAVSGPSGRWVQGVRVTSMAGALR